MTESDHNRVLLVEDTAPLARVYMEYLRSEGYEVEHQETGTLALDSLRTAPPGALVLDLKLPDMDGLEVLRAARESHPDLPVIVVTAHGSISVAVEAMRDGAFDFLVKPFTAARLIVTVRNALERRRLTRIVAHYRRELDRGSFHAFVGASAPMQTVYRLIESVAPSRASVFLTGESGTGKELAADAIHRCSPRRGHPFIAINCAAIPKDLLESEIFGHVKGAFTGAVGDRAGAARQADGGTLFLDEVCEMPMELQAKILRFVQTGTFQPVGGTQMEKVDVRFISATNRDPLAEVAAGRFREDLYYRLHVVPIHLPPLRDREGDVCLIARHFLTDMAEEEGKAFQRLDADAESALMAYDFPGNVRQLQNILRNVVVLNDGAAVTRAMLPEPLRSASADATPLRLNPQESNVSKGVAAAAATHPAGPPASAPSAEAGEIVPLWQLEKQAIQRALALTGDDVPRAAALLEISPSTIYRKLQQWKIKITG
ncbi:sigma-54-dependent transcriptional regulator [Nitrospirillum pindoramense]|uniref:Two-component system repressor protein LuxO n=1 Tax=Nitrospirillum amazonense TaxID=28077 RepID=A0A560HFG5_9PROT|nr:sigma-54 dependent transcriptional regulator [Nitrospirillum amazonense]TWB45163.1 two-component system repressor protein LuxO [Nitrospirillum amazonense]